MSLKKNYRPNKRTVRRSIRAEMAGDDNLHTESESWAVSYADFLMVLLSFFILFFSIDQKKTDDVIQQIMVATGKMEKTEGNGGAAPNEKQVDREPKSIGLQEINGIASQLLKLNWKVEKDPKKIMVHFPDNLYLPGSLTLDEKAKENMDKIVNLLSPFYDRIQLTVVGHTDETLVKDRGDTYLKDNFDLSVLRATNAVKYAVRLGVPMNILSAKGNSSHSRNSRSLSIVIQPPDSE